MVIILASNLIRSFLSISQRENILKDAQDRLEEVREENQNLQRQLAKVESGEYIEKEARNKLNLGKEGEVMLILPSISPVYTPAPTPIDRSTNWQKWVKIFL